MTLRNKLKLAVPALLLLSGSMFPTITSAQANTSISAGATYAFTRAWQHPDELLVNTINQAHSSLDIAIYSITKYNIVNAIVAAKKRGVNIRIITDRTEARIHEAVRHPD